MMTIPDVLDADDLPAAELQAMRLDGELYPLAGSWCPVDAVELPALRAAAVLRRRSPRLIAELGTAAWIWGLTPTLERPLRLCTVPSARVRLSPGAGVLVRERALDDGDIAEVGGCRVVSAARTADDLDRLSPAGVSPRSRGRRRTPRRSGGPR